jgi:DNA-binding NtrC family response regulator
MPVRVLVVDDDVSNHELVAEYLRGRGWEVDIAVDGRQARALVRSNRYDLLLTDLKLPDSDGLELLRSVSRRLPPIPGVVMTGYASVDVVVQALRMRAYDFVLKPFRLRDLFTVAEGAIARAEQDRGAAQTSRALAFYEAAAVASDRAAALALTGQLVDTISALEGVRYVGISRGGTILAQLGNPHEDSEEYVLPGEHVLAVSPPQPRVRALVAATTQAMQRGGL